MLVMNADGDNYDGDNYDGGECWCNDAGDDDGGKGHLTRSSYDTSASTLFKYFTLRSPFLKTQKA
jgi:hypothetical protein